jgi:hypothetical protein
MKNLIILIAMCLVAATAQAQNFKTDTAKKQIRVTGYKRDVHSDLPKYILINEQGESNLRLLCDYGATHRIVSDNGSEYEFPGGTSACQKTVALLDFASKSQPLVITVDRSSAIVAHGNQNVDWTVKDVTIEDSSKVSAVKKKSLIEIGQTASEAKKSSIGNRVTELDPQVQKKIWR